MTDRIPKALALSLALIVAGDSPGARGGERPAGSPRKVLVETFGPDGSGPAHSASGPGFEADRVVAIRFRVEPDWAARRLRAYRAANGGAGLGPLPLTVVDGRPRPPAAAGPASRDPAGVALDLHLDGPGPRKTCSVKLAARSPEAAGRDLLVALALTEGPATAEGEGEGRARVVRRFQARVIKLGRSGSRTLPFAVALDAGWDPSRFRLAAFVQDPADGRVHQAEELPWTRSHDHGPTLARRPARRPAPRPAFGLDSWVGAMAGSALGAVPGDGSSADDPVPCPACGTPFVPPPFGPILLRAGQVFTGPTMPTC